MWNHHEDHRLDVNELLLFRYLLECGIGSNGKILLDALVKKINNWLQEMYINCDLKIRSFHVVQFLTKFRWTWKLTYQYADLNSTYRRRYVIRIK